MFLSTPIEKIPNIGPIYQRKLKRLGIKTVYDLLFHLPHRYEDFSNLTKISGIKLNTSCCIRGKILEIKNHRTWKKRMVITKAILQDETGTIQANWFNRPYLTNVLKKGDSVFLAGNISWQKDGLYISNPSYEKTKQTVRTNYLTTNLIHTGRIVPVYPETEGLSSRWLRFIIRPVLAKLKNEIPESLPEKIRKKHNLLSLKIALWQIHFPDSIEKTEKAKKRFSFEELFFIELFVLKERVKLTQKKAYQIFLNLPLIQNFVSILPFKLTNTQRKSAWQILKDLEKPRPMNRLLEGDVGSGKTVVAAMAALNTIKRGYQVAFMAPTEILAKQHFQEISRLLNPAVKQKTKSLGSGVNIGLLTGKEDKLVSKKLKNDIVEISRRKILEKTVKKEIDILIGTHALIQDKVKFGRLALVILDEQHRFGVGQRSKLVARKNTRITTGNSTEEKIPHLLSMTATPIPRTLALTIYGDLDLSLITEMPKGRKKIITKVISPNERRKTYDFIRKEVKKGKQVFVICPRIEFKNDESDKKNNSWSEVKAVKEEYKKLSKDIFPDLKVGQLYGKMTPKEKEKIMKNFKRKLIDILVSTSVVEVGIDVPSATIMMIEGAERFGLAQLHQFRGRVGRSKYQSFCFLLADSPSEKTKQRLRALLTYDNGFKLAEKDLEIRGPGDFSGARQWGIPDLVMSSLTDIFLVEKTRQAAREILEEDPELKKYPILRAKLEKLVTFSSHSMSFKTLVDVDYKQTNIVSDDSRIFWQCFLKYDGDYHVQPIFYPISMDANVAKTFFRTLINIYKQQRRWAYGVTDIPYFLFGFLKNKKIPFFKKLSLGWELIEGHWSWATASFMIFFLGWLPLVLGGPEFTQTLFSYNLPRIIGWILTLSMIGLISSAYFSLLLLPPRPLRYRRFKYLILFLQWFSIPLMMIFFTALPALEAQTRLMFGKYMGFWPTEKTRKRY